MDKRGPPSLEPDLNDSLLESDHGFELSGKIMLSAIVILFFVVLLMVCLHLYARLYLVQARRRHATHRHHRSHAANHRIVFYVDSNDSIVTATRGLESSVVNSLPVFTYSKKVDSVEDSLDCAVCLSEFKENESGRVLPKCKHSFHIECIDMWFHSHSTCPLCRTPVEPFSIEPEDVVLTVNESNFASIEPGSGFGSCTATCLVEEEQAGTSGPIKPTHVDIPRRNMDEFENELTRGVSPASQSFRSPMSRMLSFTRILSKDRWTGGSELDIERGNTSKEQTQSDSVAATQ
jgi:hypothetical protein